MRVITNNPTMNTTTKISRGEQMLASERWQKLMRPITPEVVEEAIEIDRRLLRRMKLNEETGKFEYTPPLTPSETMDLLDSQGWIQFALHCPESTYDKPSNTDTDRKEWAKAMRKLVKYLTSEMYMTAALGPSRKKKGEETMPGECPVTQSPAP